MAIEYTTLAAAFRHAGIDNSVVSNDNMEEFILDAEAWVDNRLKTTFKAGGRTRTEVRDGDSTNLMILRRVGKEWIDADPFLTITSIDIEEVSVTPSEVFVDPPSGEIILKDTAEVLFFASTKPQQNVIVYVYGHTAVPRIINQLTAMIAAIGALVEQIGGTFDDVTSYSMPEFSASKGEPFTNIRETIVRLDTRINSILAEVRPVSHMG